MLAGHITAHEIKLWRDRRNWTSFLYPMLSVTVRSKGRGSVLEGRFGHNSRGAVVAGLRVGSIGALVVLVRILVVGGGVVASVLAALAVLAAFPILSWVACHFWTNVLSDDRDKLVRELSDVISDEGV